MKIRIAVMSPLLLLASGVIGVSCSDDGGSAPIVTESNLGPVGTATLPLQASANGQDYRLSPASFVFTSVDDQNFEPRVVSGNGTTDSIRTDLPIGDYDVLLEDGWGLRERTVREDGSEYWKWIPVANRTLTSANPQRITITEYGVTNAVFTFAVGENVIQMGQGRGGVSIDVDDCDGGSTAPACGNGACVDDSDCTGSQACDRASAVCRDWLCEPRAMLCDGLLVRECSYDGLNYVGPGDVCAAPDSCHTATCSGGTCGNTAKEFGASCGSDGICDASLACTQCERLFLGQWETSTYRVLYDDDDNQLIVSIEANDDKDAAGNPTADQADHVYFGIGVNSSPTEGRLIRIRLPPAAPGTPDAPTAVAPSNWATWQNADGASASWIQEIGSNQPGWVLDPVVWKDNTAGSGNPDWAVEFKVDLLHADLRLADATGVQLRLTLGSRMHDEDTGTNVDQARPAGVGPITNTFIQADMTAWLYTAPLGDVCPVMLP